MPAPYTIRRFKASDMDRVLEIERASFGKDAYDRKLFAEYGRKCGNLFLLAEGSRTVDGYSIACVSGKYSSLVKRGSLVRRNDLVASLESIAVDPRARGKGAASTLLKSTIRRLKLRGVESYHLDGAQIERRRFAVLRTPRLHRRPPRAGILRGRRRGSGHAADTIGY